MKAVAHTALRVFLGVMLTGGAIAGFEASLDLPLINEAMALGDSRIRSVRDRYHLPYRLTVAQPPIDFVEVVTPFRRIVQLVEQRSRSGAGSLGQPALITAIGDRINLLEIVVELTFHPMNRYVAVPLYVVELEPAAQRSRIASARTSRLPRFGARVDGMPPQTDRVPLNVPGLGPMLGGTVVAGFDGLGLEPTGIYEIVVSEAGKELARTTVDLGNLR